MVLKIIDSLPVKSLDDIWQQVCSDAQQVADGTPLLNQFMYRTVLARDGLCQAIITRLSNILANDIAPADMISRLFEEVLRDNCFLLDEFVADLIAIYNRDPACERYLDALLYYKGFHALSTHRFSHGLWLRGRKDLALYLQSRASTAFGVDIHPQVQIGRGIMLDHATGFVCGQTAIIEDNVSILHSVTLGGTGKAVGDRHPKVRSGVLIGAGAKILGNIVIGECSRIAAGSVVLKDVPAHATVAGVPARIVGQGAQDDVPAEVMDQTHLQGLDGDGV